MRVGATMLVVVLAAAGATAQPRLQAEPRAPLQEEETESSGEPSRIERVRPDRPLRPEASGPAVRKQGLPEAPLRQGIAPEAAQHGYQGLAALECASGFVKEIRPDHPHGFYTCRLLASPACTPGYEHRTKAGEEGRFTYHCLDDMAEYVQDWAGEGKPQLCPQGWMLSSPGGDYRCSSSPFRCGADHRLDGTGVEPVGSWPHHEIVYSYRCSAD